MAVESGVTVVTTTTKGGIIQTMGIKAVAIMLSPAFAIGALAGVIGWQVWKAKKDTKEIEARKAAVTEAT